MSLSLFLFPTRSGNQGQQNTANANWVQFQTVPTCATSRTFLVLRLLNVLLPIVFPFCNHTNTHTYTYTPTHRENLHFTRYLIGQELELLERPTHSHAHTTPLTLKISICISFGILSTIYIYIQVHIYIYIYQQNVYIYLLCIFM